jgi:hypothetical protein
MIEFAPRSEKYMTYDEAILYCSFCDYNGHRDWRMTTFDEYYEFDISGWYLNDPASGQYTVVPVREVC